MKRGAIIGRGVGYGALSGLLIGEGVVLALAVVAIFSDGSDSATYGELFGAAVLAAMFGALAGCVIGVFGGIVFAVAAPLLVGRPVLVRVWGMLVPSAFCSILIAVSVLSSGGVQEQGQGQGGGGVDPWWLPPVVLLLMGLPGLWAGPRVLYGRPRPMSEIPMADPSLRAVLDPRLPAAVRERLTSRPELLAPRESPPRPPRWGGRTPLETAHHFVVAAGLGILFALMTVAAGPVFAVTLGLVVLVLAFVVLIALGGELEIDRAVRAAHGRYLRADDLDAQSRALLLRAQTAIKAVLGSTAGSAGLLDDVGNAVTLPSQEWEIAQTLRNITELRAVHRSFRNDRLTGRVAAMLDEQRGALDLAIASVTERVVALETYARCVRAAAVAQAERLTLDELGERDEAYRELVARTVHDRLGAEEIADLARIVRPEGG